MGIQVIGAGFGRTGTLSLKLALERLGVGRCYHMVEVRANPHHAAIWNAAAAGAELDYDAVLGDYGATVDWPGTYFWRDLVAHYPSAKVILSVRSSSEAWHKSIRETIFQTSTEPPPADAVERRALVNMILARTFPAGLDDREAAIAAYEQHNAEVRRTVPAGRLLVYQAGEGWAPLCRFLGVPVPEEPFPHVNTTDEFNAGIG